MKENITTLKEEIASLEERAKKMRGVVEILQSLCDHDFEETKYPNFTLAVCKKCGYEEKY